MHQAIRENPNCSMKISRKTAVPTIADNVTTLDIFIIELFVDFFPHTYIQMRAWI
jgi:hypothetical protein